MFLYSRSYQFGRIVKLSNTASRSCVVVCLNGFAVLDTLLTTQANTNKYHQRLDP